MKDQLIMTDLFQQNAEAVQQNPSTILTINMDFWAPVSKYARLQNMHLWPLFFTVHWIARPTAPGEIPLCYWSELILEETKTLTLCSWLQLLNPHSDLLKYVHHSLRTSSHCYDDRWPKNPELLPAHSWVPL